VAKSGWLLTALDKIAQLTNLMKRTMTMTKRLSIVWTPSKRTIFLDTTFGVSEKRNVNIV
jgi:hypothetical protein